jgi:hypothetical protein
MVRSRSRDREDLMARMRARGPGMAIEGLDAHPPHQRGHVLAADADPAVHEEVAQQAAPRERALQMQRVDLPQEGQVAGRDRPPCVVDRGARQSEELALAHDRQPMLPGDHRAPLASGSRPSA